MLRDFFGRRRFNAIDAMAIMWTAAALGEGRYVLAAAVWLGGVLIGCIVERR
jgi:hypothetical protein